MAAAVWTAHSKAFERRWVRVGQASSCLFFLFMVLVGVGRGRGSAAADWWTCLRHVLLNGLEENEEAPGSVLLTHAEVSSSAHACGLLRLCLPDIIQARKAMNMYWMEDDQ